MTGSFTKAKEVTTSSRQPYGLNAGLRLDTSNRLICMVENRRRMALLTPGFSGSKTHSTRILICQPSLWLGSNLDSTDKWTV
jgi:hypothetical protein